MERPESIDAYATVEVTHRAAQQRAFGWSLRWLGVSALSAVVFPIAMSLGRVGVGVTSMLVAGLTSFVAASYAAGSAWPKRTSEQARVRIDRDGLTIDRRPRASEPWIAQSEIEGGAADDHALVLALRNGDEVRIEGSLGTMRNALDVLEIGAERRRAVVRWTMPARRALAYIGTVSAGFGLLSLAMELGPPRVGVLAFPLMLPVFVGAWPIARWFGDREVVVASDEVRVRRGRDVESVRLSELRAARDDRGALVLERAAGAPMRIAIAHHGTRRALVRRIARAIEDAQASHESARVAALLERKGRSLEAWKAALAVGLDAHAGHREGGLTREAIARVLEDPSATAEQRIGATLALTLAGDRDARVARVIETTASPRLRVALEAAARGVIDEEVIEEEAGARRRG